MNVFYRKQILQSQWLIVLILLLFFSLLTRQWSFRIIFFSFRNLNEMKRFASVLVFCWQFKAGFLTRLCFDSFWKIFFGIFTKFKNCWTVNLTWKRCRTCINSIWFKIWRNHLLFPSIWNDLPDTICRFTKNSYGKQNSKEKGKKNSRE